MDIKDLVEESGYASKRKAATHGGEYSSPCPFCKEGNDRFLIWPHRSNKNGEHQGGRFSCRVCGKYGDAITFLRELYGMSYLEACDRLRIEPREVNNSYTPKRKQKPQLVTAEEPVEAWKEKAGAFVSWSHEQLLSNQVGLGLLHDRGFNNSLLARFNLGYNPTTLFRERESWGLTSEIKDNGNERKLWLPAGIVIPTKSADGTVSKVKIRRSEWKEGDKYPKYVEVSGSKQVPSIYGDSSLPCAIVIESELDALIVQQEAGDLVYCIALGGSTKPLDKETDTLLRHTPTVLFCPDFDKAGAIAWSKWKGMFPDIQRILTPHEKSAGDYLLAGGDVRAWILNELSG